MSERGVQGGGEIIAFRSGRSPLRGGNGDGTSSNMEARVAKLEASVTHIERDIGGLLADVRELRRDMRSDFRLLFGAIITTTIGLAGLMAKGFGWL